MSEQSQQAYFRLIQTLLNCSPEEELEVLRAHQDLVDAELVQIMMQVAQFR